jgi:caffeoyl-CoA O-methyltransferase
MSNKTFTLSDELYEYMVNVSLREPELLGRLREETAKDEQANMQVSPEQGQFMSLLVKMLGAKRTLEVGVFTGYSSLCIALALPPDGKIIACDVSEKWTAIARRYWKEAGVSHKIDLRLAPALKTLDGLLDDGYKETFDFAFIDADKENYIQYYERALQLVRSGGLVAIDNVLWSGRVADSKNWENDTIAIRSFNEHLKNDQRVALSMVPISDGLTLALKLTPAGNSSK